MIEKRQKTRMIEKPPKNGPERQETTRSFQLIETHLLLAAAKSCHCKHMRARCVLVNPYPWHNKHVLLLAYSFIFCSHSIMPQPQRKNQPNINFLQLQVMTIPHSLPAWNSMLASTAQPNAPQNNNDGRKSGIHQCPGNNGKPAYVRPTKICCSILALDNRSG
jgi:hypothetical protein